VEQNAMLALGASHEAYVLELGRVVRQEPSAELLNDPSIIASYLGG
jgi:branched-chain amino acid transport system ATP-binding protein